MQFWVPRCSGVSVNGSKGLSGCALRARACVCARVCLCVVCPSVRLSVGLCERVEASGYVLLRVIVGSGAGYLQHSLKSCLVLVIGFHVNSLPYTRKPGTCCMDLVLSYSIAKRKRPKSRRKARNPKQ